jgi:two-component system chemotaxis response regulator CheB
MTPSLRCIVIGASAGGVDALLTIASQLAPDFPAPILCVQHIGAHRSRLAQLINAKGPNRAVTAVDGMAPLPGTIYVAPSDRHLILDDEGVIRISAAAKEHHARPAIDPLFRSAALALGPRVIGVVLTGLLDDATAGLRAIKQLGGTAVVQDPTDAYAPSMPESAIANVDVDHIVPIEAMGGLLHRLAQKPAPDLTLDELDDIRQRIEYEHSIGMKPPTLKKLKSIGEPSTFTCPDCGGVLFELHDKQPVRYRCHTGHAFSLRTLAYTQEQITDQALWTSLRSLQEKESILRRLAETGDGSPGELSQDALREADELAAAATTLRRLVEDAPRPQSFDEPTGQATAGCGEGDAEGKERG